MKSKKLGRLILIRHGESVWNITDPNRGLVSRFTGWADISLTAKGITQAQASGRCLQLFNIKPDIAFTSLLQRSKRTYSEISNIIQPWANDIPVVNTWRLNERHYGALVGLSKKEAALKMNAKDLIEWRRSWDAAPPKMSARDLKRWSQSSHSKPVTIINEPGKLNILAYEKHVTLPETESLRDCAERVKPIYQVAILPRLKEGKTILVVAHANSIRAMVRQIDHATVSDSHIRSIYIPSAIPLVYDFGLLGSSDDVVPLGEPTSVGKCCCILTCYILPPAINLPYTHIYT